MGTLKGGYIPGILHHTDDPLLSRLIPADRAQLLVRQIAAHRAVVDLLMGVQNSLGKIFSLFLWQLQNMVSKPLGGFSSDPRKPLKLLHQSGKRRNLIPGHTLKHARNV
jgi:hypothetical protein